MSKKKLSIELWNEILYKNCKYNPYLSGIYYLGGSVLPFLSNDIYTYIYNPGKGLRIDIKTIQAKQEDSLVEGMGIGINRDLDSDDLVNEIKKSIQQDCPVLVPVDRFFWDSYNKNENSHYYRKHHFAHYFLIFGYDDSTRDFDTVDVGNAAVHCFKSKVTYSNLSECYKGWLEWQGPDTKEKISILSRHNGHERTWDVHEYQHIYTTNWRYNYQQIVSGINDLKKAADYYQGSAPEEILDLTEGDLAPYFFRIDRLKKVELFTLYKLFTPSQEIMNVLKQVIYHFSSVRVLFIKIILKKEFDRNIMVKISQKLTDIYNLENEYKKNLEKLF